MHDRYGNPIQVGDRVLIEAEVVTVHPYDEYCNVGLKVGEEGQENGPYNTITQITVNAKQTELLLFGSTVADARASVDMIAERE